MANPSGVGTKFVSVNLNKSYGPVSNNNRIPNSNNTTNNSSYGQTAGRGRGSGMVVLSRPRSGSQKLGSKLSVPPPLNLPSLRKEHERFDLSGPGGGSDRSNGSATRPTSGSLGWTKPVISLDSEKSDKFDDSEKVDVKSGGGNAYMPPSARFGGGPSLVAHSVDKAAVLRGEDFPSLKAALPSVTVSGSTQKPKDHQKQKQLSSEELGNLQRERPASTPEVQMTRDHVFDKGSNEKGSATYGLGNFPTTGQARKPSEFFSGPIPMVRVNPRSDWADDERDTGHGFVERSKDYGYSNNNEAYWDRDFDMPRNRVLPPKPADNQFQRWGKRENENVKTSSEVPKVDPIAKSSWRSSPLPKDGYDAVGGRGMDFNREMGRDDKFAPPRAGEYFQGSVTGTQGFNSGRKDGFGQGQQRFHMDESSNSIVNDRNMLDFYGNEQSHRYKGYGLQNSYIPKSSFSPGGKGYSANDSALNIGREKREFSNGERSSPLDAFLGPASFDDQDPFSSGLFGVIKRKKDVKQADFHDPVRESFEAELERVQKMQEQERQRVVEEQERAIEQARREEEERHKLIREEEEQQRRAEEAAREASWRTEQERLEAIRRAEEHRIAREEEKRNMMMEEERRKQAAKQKLLELEARIAKRKVETVQDNSSAATSDDKGTNAVVNKDVQKMTDFQNWEDSERMVERIMTSDSSDSSVPNRSFEPGHRSQSSREGDSGLLDRVNYANPWRKDVLESGNTSSFIDQNNGHHSPRRDASVGGRAFPKKDFHGGPGYMPSRNYYRGGNQENYAEDYPYSRNMTTDPEFHDNVPEKYGDRGWGQGNLRGNAPSPYQEKLSTDGDELYPYGRSRYSMRQPRVLPPPSLVPTQKTSFREENERPCPSVFMPYNRSSGNGSNMRSGYYSGHKEKVESSEVANVLQQNNVAQKQMDDSHSSLSVSSPPDSSTHLSHDDLDESRNSPTVLATEGKLIVADTETGKDSVMDASGVLSDADEDWSIGNNGELQEQEVYDEDEDGYQEDEVHVEDGDDIDLTQEFDDLHIAEKGSPDMENLVLGFDQGVQVGLSSDYVERSSMNEDGAFVDHENRVDTTIADSTVQPIDTIPPTVPPSDIASHASAQTVMSTVPVSTSPIDMPIKLQFGLFSGPPLIPSPVPAIQIGSIQMPLHIHPSVNPSLTQLEQSQAPLFQFGKLRYTSPISQGIVPMAPQMSFVRPNVQVHYNLNQSSIGRLPVQAIQEGLPNNIVREDVSTSSVGGGSKVVQKKVPEVTNASKNMFMPKTGEKDKWFSDADNYIQQNGTVSKGLHHSEDSRGLRAQGQQSGYKSKRYAYVARNSNARPAFPVSETSRYSSGGLQMRPRRTVQRTEFRIRETADYKPSFTGRNVGVFVKSVSNTGSVTYRPAKQMDESEPSSSVEQTNTDFRVDNKIEKESSSRVENNPQSVEANRKGNIISDEDVEAPLQSGIVRVFKQPGIEIPSDEDDFIQVRSKRKMLNDRREQREKEIKAKSRVMKGPRRGEPIAPGAVIPRSSNKGSAILGGKVVKHIRSDVVESRGFSNIESCKGFTTAVSQPLAPIGTPAVASDEQADKRPLIIKSLQSSANSAIPKGGEDLGAGLVFSSKNEILDDVQASLVSWGNSHINQQVIALTQTQLDEAMRPDRFDAQIISTSGHGSSIVNPTIPTSSMLTNDKTYSSTASPVNSLLAGEKIQFGAVTSPTVLPPSSRAVSHGIRAPGSSRSEQMSNSLSICESICTPLFEKEKQQSEPCDRLEDSEAEAEAAASAVAVAAIGTDENIPVSNTKGFRAADINGVMGGAAGDQKLPNQSRAEESLSVALPADLSVETPLMSLWPPLPSPPSSSGQMLSHFPGGPSSPFPFYEMSPMMGGPIFAFGPHDESGGNQSQSQKSNDSGSGPLGSWQQFHSGPDSFYGPPAGFPGPYIGPHRGIPGVQGPPHMVVYNHFPVGQFGQVGLSFMGTTYIPSGKQPDWKHNHTAPNREGDITNMNMGNGQHNPPGMASPVQHVGPPSQLLPMPSPLALFDASPFKSSPDVSVQGRWPHVTSSPLCSVPPSMPLQQQETGVLNYSQINHGRPPSDQLLTANRISESRTTIPSDSTRTQPISTDSSSTQFSNELGLVNSSSNVPGASKQNSTIAHSAKADDAQCGGHNNNTGQSMKTYKARAPPSRNFPSQQQYNHQSSGYGYQRNRIGYNHGRNNSVGTDKSFPSKMKQIYVAKQTTKGGSAVE